ncbi:hypothetical protein [Nonomuraea typhae]|uniref:hypothetical protein n=1 Tax=Nonomuraea typhae TaxID=2603600 RepID=UPI0012F9EAD9|nr:hypothetical protein [Nonomuraea typhae]
MPGLKDLLRSLRSRLRGGPTREPTRGRAADGDDAPAWCRNPAFPVFGLPFTWDVVRGIGCECREPTTRLTLTHRISGEADLNVSSFWAPPTSRVARFHAAMALARRVANPSPARGIRQDFPAEDDAERVTVSIDGEMVELTVIHAGEHWVALGRLGEVFLELDASGISIADIELTRITDAGPYLR